MLKAKDVMTKNVISFPPDANVDLIALAIGEHQFRRVPIVEEDIVVGIVSRHDIIRVMLSIGVR